VTQFEKRPLYTACRFLIRHLRAAVPIIESVNCARAALCLWARSTTFNQLADPNLLSGETDRLGPFYTHLQKAKRLLTDILCVKVHSSSNNFCDLDKHESRYAIKFGTQNCTITRLDEMINV
jgi:hypothetical protein